MRDTVSSDPDGSELPVLQSSDLPVNRSVFCFSSTILSIHMTVLSAIGR